MQGFHVKIMGLKEGVLECGCQGEGGGCRLFEASFRQDGFVFQLASKMASQLVHFVALFGRKPKGTC